MTSLSDATTTQAISPTTLADLELDGVLEGMKPHYIDIDAEIAAKYPCCRCGGACTYRGFRGGRTYLAYQQCLACGHCAEF